MYCKDSKQHDVIRVQILLNLHNKILDFLFVFIMYTQTGSITSLETKHEYGYSPN